MNANRTLLALATALVLLGCDQSPKATYVEMSTAAQLGDVDGFLAGFDKDSRKLVEAQIQLSEAYGMEDLNPYRLLVFDSVEEEIVVGKGELVGEKYECPKAGCAVLHVMSGNHKRKILMVKLEEGWRIDAKELEEFWKLEKNRW